jgi:hypothetical protein
LALSGSFLSNWKKDLIKALFTRDILAHNFAIKRKKILQRKDIFEPCHRFPHPTKVSSEKNVRYLELRAYLGQKKPVAQKYFLL